MNYIKKELKDLELPIEDAQITDKTKLSAYSRKLNNGSEYVVLALTDRKNQGYFFSFVDGQLVHAYATTNKKHPDICGKGALKQYLGLLKTLEDKLPEGTIDNIVN